MKNHTTLGVFPVSESRSGYIHDVGGIKHVSSCFAANILPPKFQNRPWNEVHRFGSFKKRGAPVVEL
jgi:hypothetical protein